MQLDVIDLREFYTRPLGAVSRRLIGSLIRQRWANVTGMSVIGLGYTTPYLAVFRGEAERIGALMPAGQGVITWPELGPMKTTLVQDTSLPLSDASVDRLLIVHGLESSDNIRAVLREAWRVLSHDGRMLLVVPNRRSLWSFVESTPFGHGRPFSRGQLTLLLRDAMFTPMEWEQALFLLPWNWQLGLKWASTWERLGGLLWPAFSGVIVVEAGKQIYSAMPTGEAETVRGRLAPVPAGVSVPRAANGADEPA